MLVQDLGTMPYHNAWALQEKSHAEVLSGGPERILLVEHPPVITHGRRPGGDRNLLAPQEQLTAFNVELIQSDRGGDITFHGPGQLVAYPIIRLADHRLSVSGYVHALEDAVIDLLADFGLIGKKDPCAIGVWITQNQSTPAKICAIGVRIRRGVTLHGLALNVSTDLNFFNLIIPCGLQDRAVTSLKQQLGPQTPDMSIVKTTLIQKLNQRFTAAPISTANVS